MKQMSHQQPGTRRTLYRLPEYHGHYVDCVPGLVCHCSAVIGPAPRLSRALHVSRTASPWRTYGDHDPGDEDRS